MGHQSKSKTTRHILAGAVAAMTAGAMPAAYADIDLGKGFSIAGFLDQSFCTWSKFDNVCGNPGGEKKKFGIDQFETDFKYAGTGGVSAEVDIEYGDGAFPGGTASGNATFVEQAFVTKKFNDQFSVKVGRFLSYTGWEAEEPTGLFQWSGTGYGKYFYGFYQQGVSAAYDAGKVGFTVSVLDSAFNPYNYDAGHASYELGATVKPLEGLTSKLFYTRDKKTDTDIINFWTSYAVAGWTFAGEYNSAKYAGPVKGDGYLLMANYATGPYGITLRYHGWNIKDGVGGSLDKQHGFTVSPNYKVGDNLLLVAEYRKDKVTGVGKPGEFALEVLFSF
jgi:hypothetical protein